jgi:hypothetical protein
MRDFLMHSSDVTYESGQFSRVIEVLINGKSLLTPTYFPAVSSYGMRYPIQSLIYLLTARLYPRLLISAYDYYHLDDSKKDGLSRRLREYSTKGSFVFFDSGIYESYWKSDPKWTYDLYKATISLIESDFYSSFDVLPVSNCSTVQFREKAFKSILASSKLSEKSAFVPIMHGLSPDELMSTVKGFVRKYPHLCDFVAVPERDCGNSIIAKANTITKIRKMLDQNSGHGRILHLLGCGNPRSLALYSYCGVNTFDSLDWTQHVIDQSNLTLLDFSHLELIDCKCAICKNPKVDYTEKALLHNLLFYQNYVLEIQSLIRGNEILEFLHRNLGKGILEKIDRLKT